MEADVARGRPQTGPTGRMSVLVATDGSLGALYAADWVAGHFEPWAITLTIVVVRERYSPKFDSLYPMYTPIDDEESTEAWAEQAARETALRLHAFSAAMHIRVGDPVREILAEARKNPPDLLVVGHRGLRGLEGVVMGSVAKSLVQHSPVPVLVVPVPRATFRSESALSPDASLQR